MKNIKVVIINLSISNIVSIERAINKLGFNTLLSNDKKHIEHADFLILPGVGSFNFAMQKIKDLNLNDPIQNHAIKYKPLLGICLGMQLLYKKSYENNKETEGLGILDGEVIKIPNQFNNKEIKVPHIGWKNIHLLNNKNIDDKIFNNYSIKNNFYFVHSYYLNNLDDTIAYVKLEDIKIPAVIKNKNIYAFQFHPEKSGNDGINLLLNFFK